MTKALVPLADGFEEMEAVIVIDTLRRASWDVCTASILPNETVVGSRGVRIKPDSDWTSIDLTAFDALVIPGGLAGVDALSEFGPILEAVREFAGRGKWLAAICAGPLVLQAAGVLAGRRLTCHPAVRELLRAGELSEEKRVVIDGRVITSQGPGTALEFALALIAAVDGREKANSLGQVMLARASVE